MIAIYARQSLDKKDSLSIETQIELCQAEAGGNAPCKLYIDRGYSGKNTDRPHFTKMMHDIEAGRIDKVVVYKLDRLSRSLLDFAGMINVFKKYNVEFSSAREKFDTSTPIGNAMLSIIMVFAQLERETTQVRVRDSFHARAQKGTYDALAPYGYVKAKAIICGKPASTIVVDEITADVVRRIFEDYAYSSHSLGFIARDLNSKGIFSPAGVEWDSGKLSRIMANPIYVKADGDIYRYYKALGANVTNPAEDYAGIQGCVTYGAWDRIRRKFDQWQSLSISVGLHKGIIDSKIFLMCQQKLNANCQINNSGRGKHTWLTGLIKCGYCHRAYKVMANGKYKPRLLCTGFTNYGTCHSSVKWDVMEAESIVRTELFRYVNTSPGLIAKEHSEMPPAVRRLKIQEVKLSEQIDNLVSAIAGGNAASIKHINARIEQLELKRDEVMREIQGCLQEHSSIQDAKQFGDIISIWLELDIQQKREVAKTLIDRINLFDGKIEIVWKYKLQAS